MSTQQTLRTRRQVLAMGGAVAGTAGAALVRPSDAHGLTTVNVSSYGFNATDSTPYIQAALASSYDVVVLDDVGAEWLTRPLTINRSVIFELAEGAVLRGVPGAFTGAGDCLLRIGQVSGVTIRGAGTGATVKMNKAEFTTGEWRHALYFAGTSNVAVSNLVIDGSGGDGIYLGRGSTVVNCSNVTVTNVTATDHRRNCMSVIAVNGLTVTGSAFNNASGTAPQSGMDLEPNMADEALTGITISNCTFAGNVDRSFLVQTVNLTPTSTPVDIQVSNCTFHSNISDLPNVHVYGRPSGTVSGTVTLDGCTIERSGYHGLVGLESITAGALSVSVDTTTMNDAGTVAGTFPPVSVRGYGCVGDYGTLSFGGGTLATAVAGAWLRCRDFGSTGVTGIAGTIDVTNPLGVTQDYGASPGTISLTVT